MVDTITIEKIVNALVVRLKGKPHETINIQLEIEQMLPVNNEEFRLEVKDISVPWSHNNLAINAFHVERLTMAVKFFLWITRTIQGNNGHATYSLNNIPRGYYDIKISGTAIKDAKEVDLRVSASAIAQLNHEGVLDYNYNIQNIVEGVFKARAGDKESQFEIS